MRLSLMCIVVLIAASGSPGFAGAEEAKSKVGGDLERLLSDYLQARLEQAKLAFESLTRQKEAGIVTLPQVLAAEDEIDRWRLHLRLATEAKLISNHPILGEIRREFGVPEIAELSKGQNVRVVSLAVQEYLRKRLQRAERVVASTTLLHRMGRVTESDVLAARSKEDGLRLLLEVEQEKAESRKE